ncbi:MATE family efflux transporter [Romboutsia ilealis]|uniref:Multidrug export protein MepA n=1 Tax=Romboutsia faecis TaxID=2764597 RepID=A0ABR7JNQ9_9FIRM|nr:MATE family efflux transporter [Romboutsia faecis]MBC5996397.1 MATE family efflux transporter [Romboutsia faecis]MRN26024.1 MATE family efflux transporter [Romboutsia ilealis]
MRDNEVLGTEPISKLLLKYSVPAIIGMMVNGLYNIVDRIFIGNIPNVGSLAITGLGITMPIMTIILAFGMLIGIGTATNMSIRLGQGKVEEAKDLVQNAITLALLIGAIITFLGIIFSDKILMSFGASESTLPYAKTYINIILIGSIPNLFAFSLNHIIRADGSPKISASIMVAGCLLNIVLDWIFIFKFNLGIKGAAIATITSQSVTAILGIYYYISGKSNLKIKNIKLKLNKHLIKIIFAIGVSPFFMQIAASMVQVVCNNSLRKYGGDLAIGAMTTVGSISMIFLMPIFGMNQGSQPIIGFNYGAKQFNRAKNAYILSCSAATLLLLIGTIVVQVFPHIMIGLFNKDPKLMEISTKGIRVYLLMMPIVGISITGTNYIQSIGKAKVAMILSLLRQVIILVPALIILPRFFGLNGVWMAQPVADFVSTSIISVIIIKELRSYKVKNEKLNEDLKMKIEIAIEEDSK